MTLLDAFGLIFAGIAAFFTAPMFLVAVSLLVVLFGVLMIIIAFIGYAEESYKDSTVLLLIGVAATLLGVAVVIWAGSSETPTYWSMGVM